MAGGVVGFPDVAEGVLAAYVPYFEVALGDLLVDVTSLISFLVYNTAI